MAPIVGLGTTVEFASGASPSVYTTLTGVNDVKFSGDKVTTVKTTDMLATDGVDTFIAATQDPGTVDVKCFYEPGDSSQVELEGIRLNREPVNFKVVYPLSLGSKSFSGIVESATIALPLDKDATIDYKIKLTGPWTIA